MSQEPESSETRATPPLHCGLIAVVGRASVGKSTFVNAVFEEKVSIVSDIPQTTRTLVRGILTEPRGQLVLLDTPGVHKAEYDLGRLMNRVARASVEGVDAVLLMLDASTSPRIEDDGWIRRLLRETVPVLAVLNKSDVPQGHADEYRKLWETIAAEKQSTKTAEWVEISARTRDGVDQLVSRLFELLPPGPLLFPAEMLTDHPRKINMADIIREKYFGKLQDELPHSLAIEVETVEEKPDEWIVHGTILVERSSQKGIVIGHKGRLLRRVCESAGRELSEMYGIPVTLDLWVKVEKDWTKNFWILKRLGYAG
ncbi:MAG TPA: GTPase Era [Kiritimatiellia bacterium]|nr:GTPase Era [Kiritimatiellia bacterium]